MLICELLFVTRLEWVHLRNDPKVVSDMFLLFCFLNLKENTLLKREKMFSISIQMLFSFLTYSSLKIYNLIPGPFLKESSVKRSFGKSACWFWYTLIVLVWHIEYNQIALKISCTNRGCTYFFINTNVSGPRI